MIHNVAVVFKVQQEENYIYIYICGTVEKTSVISDEDYKRIPECFIFQC